MNITLKELSESFAHLGKLSQIGAGQGISGKQAYWISRIAETAESEMKRMEKLRVDLVKRYGRADDKGNYSVLPDQSEAFSTAFEELLETVIEIPGSHFTITDEQVEKMGLSGLDLARLRWLLLLDIKEAPEVSTAAASGD